MTARKTASPGKAVAKTETASAVPRPARARPSGSSRARDSGAAEPTPEAKPKLVRDSFTIPKGEYLVLGGLKERAAHLRRPTKKSELLRAGIAALAAMGDRTFLAALEKVPSLKTGRPKDEPAPTTRR
jgi:hypothetical protein